MCGLVGGTMWGAEAIAAGLDAIAHRGRDARGIRYYEGDDLWLAHNRLSIQGVGEGADQPYELDDIAVAYNGELWRRTMDAHPLHASDTALLAELYAANRDDPAAFAAGLDGMFAFAIYDYARGRLVLGRDRLGRIPLYTYASGGRVAFASEAKALCGLPGARFAGPGERAQAKSPIKLFPPGTVAVYDLRGGGAPVVTRYADWAEYRVPELGFDLPYYADGLRRRLEDGVVNETIADVPVCTILSGGIDSTIVTAILARHIPDLRAYTVSVGPSDGRDDLAWARRAASVIGVPLTEVVVDPADVLPALEEAVWAVEDPRWVQVAPAVPQIALARRIGADGYKVVFGGEGSDELFGSYGNIRRWSWRPEQYTAARLELVAKLHDNNIIRGNKAMMAGGTVELRTPFLDREVVDFCLRIPAEYRDDRGGRGKVVKPVLREAFRGLLPDDLLMRPKVTFQEGAHSAPLLESWRDVIGEMFGDMFNRR